MIEILLSLLVPPVVGYVVDRWGYNRKIGKVATAISKTIPNKTARSAVEQAVIAANQKEIERAVAKLEEAQRVHRVRMAAIESGAANYGDLGGK
jgi:hypothetical protein